MDRIFIYPPKGETPIIEAPLNSGAKIVCKLMGEYYIELSFQHTEILPLVRGSYITYNDRIYYLRRDAAPESLSNVDGYRYVLKFYGLQHLMEDCVFRWLTGINKETTFNLTTNLDTFASLLVENMTTYMGNTHNAIWSYTPISEDMRKQTKGISFDGISCWQAMDNIAKAFEVEWSVTEVVSNSKRMLAIKFGNIEVGEYIDIREGEIISRFPAARRGEDDNFGNRFYVFGGTKNIPDDYYKTEIGGTTNHISEKRLHLPNGKEYIDVVPGLSPIEVIEKTITLDNIFPENTETITSIMEVDREIISGEKNTAYVVVCENTAFDPETMKIGTLGATFTSGALEGREFELSIKRGIAKGFNGQFEIIAKVEGAGGSNQIIIPNEYIKPAIGDTFVLTGVKLPTENVKNAERRLLKKGEELVHQYYADTNIYDCTTNPVFCYNNHVSMTLGQRVRLLGSHFGTNGRKSRIQGFEKSLFEEYKATYNIGDNTLYSKTLSSILKIDTALSKEIDETYSRVDQTLGKVHVITRDNNDNKENIEKIAEDREYYRKEELEIYTDRVYIDKEYGNFAANYEILRDAEGNVLRDKNGDILRARTPNLIFGEFKMAVEAYEKELKAVIQSQGIVEPSEAYSIARDAYYEARAKLMTMITDGTKERIDNVDERVTDLDYLRQTFGEDNVADSNGVTLSRMVSVKDENNNVVAGLYGGGVESLNSEFEDDRHGTLMFFAGAESVQKANEANHRVYEDGSVYTKTGIFEGVVKHRVVDITLPRLSVILSNTGELIDGNNTYIITPDMMSAIMNFTNKGVHDIFQFTSSDHIAFIMPVLYNNTLYGANGITTKDELRGLIGTRFIIYNNTPAFIHFCGRRYWPNPAQGEAEFSNTDVCYDDWIIEENRMAIAECKIDLDNRGAEVVYWDIRIGRQYRYDLS